MGSTQADLAALPTEVRQPFGQAIRHAQEGSRHPDAKSMKGFGDSKIVEVVEDHKGDTFRAIYTIRFAGLVFVLHVFQKKSTKGVATPKPIMDTIHRRLKEAEQIYEHLKKERRS